MARFLSQGCNESGNDAVSFMASIGVTVLLKAGRDAGPRGRVRVVAPAGERDTLHLSITDAAGHDVASALTTTLLVGALRGASRPRPGRTGGTRQPGHARPRWRSSAGHRAAVASWPATG